METFHLCKLIQRVAEENEKITRCAHQNIRQTVLVGNMDGRNSKDSSCNLIRGFVLFLTAFYRIVRLYSEMGRDCWASAVLIGNYSTIHSRLQNLSTVPEKAVVCYGCNSWCLAMGQYRGRIVDNSVPTGLF
jgi:hypothetical protein